MRYLKTELGKQVVNDRSKALTPKQRSTLIIINGERTLVEVMTMVSGLGVTFSDIQYLLALGFIAERVDAENTATSGVAEVSKLEPSENTLVDINDAQSRYRKAYPLATQLTAQLGLRGFRLNLSVEAAGSYSQLLAIFPKIKEAAGAVKSEALEKALRGDA